jgi:uncharacterized membrane protein
VNPIAIEVVVLVLTAISFWLLDRYVVGLERL